MYMIYEYIHVDVQYVWDYESLVCIMYSWIIGTVCVRTYQAEAAPQGALEVSYPQQEGG